MVLVDSVQEQALVLFPGHLIQLPSVQVAQEPRQHHPHIVHQLVILVQILCLAQLLPQAVVVAVLLIYRQQAVALAAAVLTTQHRVVLVILQPHHLRVVMVRQRLRDKVTTVVLEILVGLTLVEVAAVALPLLVEMLHLLLVVMAAQVQRLQSLAYQLLMLGAAVVQHITVEHPEVAVLGSAVPVQHLVMAVMA